MNQSRKFLVFSLFAVITAGFLSCDKPGNEVPENPTGPYNLSYGDSIIYLKPVSGDYIVKPETTYTFSFTYEDEIISAQTYVQGLVNVSLTRNTVSLERIEYSGGTGFPGGPGGPGSFTPEIVDISWANSNSDYYFVVVKNVEEEPDYVNEFFQQLSTDEDRPERFFRTEPEVTDVYSINSQRELQIYGTYEIIVYRLNAEYAALYETVGSSTLSIKEPPSNIKNGLGIFTGVTPHYLYLEVIEK